MALAFIEEIKNHIVELCDLADYVSQAQEDNSPELALLRLADIETELATLDSLVEKARKGLVDEVNSKPPVNEEIVNCRYCKQPIQVGKGQYLEANFEKGLMGWFHYPVCKWKIEEEWKQEEKYTISINDTRVYETAYKDDALRRFYQLHTQSSGEIVLSLNGHLVDNRASLVPEITSPQEPINTYFYCASHPHTTVEARGNSYYCRDCKATPGMIFSADSPIPVPAPIDDLPYEVSGIHSGETWEHGRGRTKQDALYLVKRYLAIEGIDYVTVFYVNQAGNQVLEDYYRAKTTKKGYIFRTSVH